MSRTKLTAEERYRLLVKGASDYAMIFLDAEGRITGWNTGAERITGWSEAEVLGRPQDLIFTPEDRAQGVPAQELGKAATEGRALDLRWHLRKDGSRFFADVIMETFHDENEQPRGFAKILRDITEQAERAGRERFLAELAERARRLTNPDEVIADAVHSAGKFLGVSRCIFADIDIEADTCTIHPDYRADDLVASIEGVVPISAFGPFVVAEYAARRAVAVDDVRLDPIKAPTETLAAYEAIGIRAHITMPAVYSDRVVSCISVHNATPRHWKPEEVELLQTVVERTWLTIEVTRQERALIHEAEERREARERTARILESITDAFFALDGQFRFTYVNAEAERLLSLTRQELLGRNIWEAFPEAAGSTFDQQYRRAVNEGAAVSFEEFYPPLDAWLEVRAYPSADGLSVFFQNVNARKQAENERERLLGQQRARAEREALINRIGQALRRAPDPQQVLEAAVRELGEALSADWCYYAAYDQGADIATVGPDWHREDLPSIAGQYPMSRFGVNHDPVYKAGHTQVVTNLSEDAATLKLGLRALVRVPLVSGASMTALSVAMADGPRDWTQDEVALVEAVATQTQTALEAALVSRKQHAIAQQLQAALQPSVPTHVLGLSVGSFTRPALDEASIGGDFYDLFPLDKELYALVIGDVSGKGLAAAQQLALIRNSLRTTLYLYRTPAQAAASLNTIVTAHDLLVGFVTAFVGVYDAATGEITYASCGHEPGLIRRAGGIVEELGPTGPPLGVDQNASYSEGSVKLAAGDTLLLYTDGLSEAGPSRRELLGTAGLTHLLRSLPEGADVQEQSEALVAQVSDFAGGVFRDDMAVLLARRE